MPSNNVDIHDIMKARTASYLRTLADQLEDDEAMVTSIRTDTKHGNAGLCEIEVASRDGYTTIESESITDINTLPEENDD